MQQSETPIVKPFPITQWHFIRDNFVNANISIGKVVVYKVC